MIESNINKIKGLLRRIEKEFPKEELESVDDDSIRWFFYDIQTQLDIIENKTFRFKENLEGVIKNHHTWGI
jgi:hypothetical protein